PVEHRGAQAYDGSQKHQGATQEMDQREPGAHDLLPLCYKKGGVSARRTEEVPHALAGRAHAAGLRGRIEPEVLRWTAAGHALIHPARPVGCWVASLRTCVAETPKSCLKSRANWSGRT